MEQLICFKCHKNFKGISQLTSHFRRSHAIMITRPQSTGFICKQDNCNKHYLRFNSFIRHIRQDHCVNRTSSPPRGSSENTEIPMDEFEVTVENENDMELSDDNVDEAVNENARRRPDIMATTSRMIATLRASSSFTGALLSKVIEATESLLADISDFVKYEVTHFCESEDVDVKSPNFESFLNKFEFKNLFEGMNTLEGQIEALKKNYHYIEAIEIPLGCRIDQRFDVHTQQWEQKQVYETAQYVPIIETLKTIMSHDFVRECVDSERDAPEDWLYNFRDGNNFKSHVFFQKYPTALRILLYYDDFVVNNPLGSKVHPHKLGGFYFVIQNLPQHLNSFLGGVHVLCLAHTADIEKYGIAAVLQPFLRDLRELESDTGVPVINNDTQWVLRASLAAVSADGLAAHQLFGFLSPAASHFCRLCMINRNDFHNNTNVPSVPRTKELYNEQVRNINAKQTLKDIQNAKTRTGVNENSALHSSRYFNCTENHVFDAMHDILQGIGAMELKLVLRRIISSDEYDLNLDTFNSRIHLFKYGLPDIQNKPSSNFSLSSIMNAKDHKISQTAAQTWCLLRVFPFLVSDKVPEDDEYLLLILLLNRIIEIVFAPKLRKSVLPYLSELIIDHENLFRKLFQDINPINKHHHLRHYSECIEKSGPLRWLSCFRFEFKHGLFKKHGSICCNYKNLPKTMIAISQISQCSVWGTGESPRNRLKHPNGETLLVINTYARNKLHEIGLKDDDYVLKVNRVGVYGIEYREELFVVADSGAGGDITFGRIKEILILNGKQVFLWCEEWYALWLQESLNAYCVGQGSDYRLIDTDDLCDLKPLSLWLDYKTNFSYICLRHMVSDS